MKVINFFLYLYLFLFLSCSGGTYINLKPIKTSETPNNLIWLQVEGLGVTHLGFLRFGSLMDQDVDLLNQFTCLGVNWPQSFFAMRPQALQSMDAQIIGAKGINGTCEDYNLTPFWERFLGQKKKVVMLEIDSGKNNSIDAANNCNTKFLEDVTLLKMGSGANSQNQKFSYRQKLPEIAGVYSDEYCHDNKKECLSTPLENIRFVNENLFNKHDIGIFVIRDFKYKNLINQNRIKDAAIYLNQLISAIQFSHSQILEPKKLLHLITGANSIEVEFPENQLDWKKLMQNNKIKKFSYSGLQNLILARGSSSENFCGSFSESEIINRLLFHAKREKKISEIFQDIF